MMDDVLSKIITNKRQEVKVFNGFVSKDRLLEELSHCKHPIYSLYDALQKSKTGIIAEFKRKSPSKGWINEKAIAKDVIVDYKDGGAAAISVLTDTKYFGGLMDDLKVATHNVDVPVLRKDFIIDESQIIQARLLGASAILLIAAALTKKEVNNLTRFATELGLDVLLELHDESELDYITPSHKIIGINNRNLGTFATNIEKSFQMAKHLPQDAVWVAESGISNTEIVSELREAGYKGFLIGENFMKNDNPGASLTSFIANI